jgi:hypothetical protein
MAATTPSEEQQYNQWRQQLSEKCPNLQNEDYRHFYPRRTDRKTRMACVEFHAIAPVTLIDLQNADELRDHLNAPLQSTPRRRLFILEDFNDEIRAAIGLRLQVDPQLFHRHVRIGLWERSRRDAGNTLPLPSLANSDKMFALEYVQMLHLNLKSFAVSESGGQFALRAADTERHIAISRIDGRMDGVGALQSRLSFWGQKRGNGGWDGKPRLLTNHRC